MSDGCIKCGNNDYCVCYYLDRIAELEAQLAQAEAVQRVLARECEKYDNGKRVLTQWTAQHN